MKYYNLVMVNILMLDYMDPDSFSWSRKPKTGTRVTELKDLQKKRKLYDFCKSLKYPELNSEDNEFELGQLKFTKQEILKEDESCEVKGRVYAYKTNVKKQKRLREFTNGTFKNIRLGKYFDRIFDALTKKTIITMSLQIQKPTRKLREKKKKKLCTVWITRQTIEMLLKVNHSGKSEMKNDFFPKKTIFVRFFVETMMLLTKMIDIT